MRSGPTFASSNRTSPFPPGEHIEEASKLPAIRVPQVAEGFGCPDRSTSLGERPEGRGREPRGSQLPAVGVHPDSVPAIALQMSQDGELGAHATPVDREPRLARPGVLQFGWIWFAVPPLERPPLGGNVDGISAWQGNRRRG